MEETVVVVVVVQEAKMGQSIDSGRVLGAASPSKFWKPSSKTVTTIIMLFHCFPYTFDWISIAFPKWIPSLIARAR
jgi:hypothetical protein